MQLPKRKPGKYSQIPVDHVMTQDKFDSLERELADLHKKRPATAKEVARLAELGDFSENVEYQLAKRRLRGINSAILKLEFRINNAEIISSDTTDVVTLGSTVTVQTKNGARTYTILGAAEADPAAGIISHKSPLGAALLDLRVGDVVEAEKVGAVEVVEIQ